MTEHQHDDAPLDPAEFDITSWLTPEGDTTRRQRKTVTLYMNTGLGAQIDALAEERRTLEQQEQAAAGDRAVGEPNPLAELEQREAALLEQLQSARVDVTVVATILSEQDRATRGINPERQKTQYIHAILAESVVFPDGSKLPAGKWPQLHNTIGDGQINLLYTTWAAVTNGTPKVTAPFSRRS